MFAACGVPERIVRCRVGIDGFVQTTVHAEVGLLVALQAQARHRDGPVHRALAYPRQHAALADAQVLAAAQVEAQHAQARC